MRLLASQWTLAMAVGCMRCMVDGKAQAFVASNANLVKRSPEI
jgi:hypothetical protein